MDAFQLFSTRYEDVHSNLTARLLGDLTEQKMRTRPHPNVNSIAWILWHVARTEDVAVNRLIGNRRQVIDQEEWLPRLNLTRRDIGAGMSLAEVDDLSSQIDLVSLRAYWDSVGRRTVEVVRATKPIDLFDIVDLAHARTVVVDEGAAPIAESVIPAFARSKGAILIHLALTHTTRHFGEADIIRALF
jgi:hypothetical protein